MEDLLDIPFDRDLKFVSFDFEKMYSNIPVAELAKIIEVVYEQNGLYTKTRNEIIQMYYILTKQNYFQYEYLQHIQEDGLAMGAPTSSILSEICLRYLENSKSFDILLKHNFRICTWYPNIIQKWNYKYPRYSTYIQ